MMTRCLVRGTVSVFWLEGARMCEASVRYKERLGAWRCKAGRKP
jgi:hypothetical protein